MIKRLSDEEISGIYESGTNSNIYESTKGMQKIQIELQLRILDVLKEKQ